MQTKMGTPKLLILATAALAIAAGTAPAATVSLPEGALLAVPNPNLRTVAIEIDDASTIEGALIRIQYNRSIAVATGVSATAMTSSCLVESNLNNPTNEVQISMACQVPLTGSGPMFTINFAGANPGLTNLTFLACDLNEAGTPPCQVDHGNLRVSTCALDVDADGTTGANTDGVYIFRGLPPTLQTVVPATFRALLPGITADSVILDNMAAVMPLLDVDSRSGSVANTDGVYIFRALPPTLQTIVPATFRILDPTIPPDSFILNNVNSICP